MADEKSIKIIKTQKSHLLGFAHPGIPNYNGKLGRNIIIDLNTEDEDEAKEIYIICNQFLIDNPIFNFDSIDRTKIDSRILSVLFKIFDNYYKKTDNPDIYRDILIPLPSLYEDCNDTLFLGSTGSGKTSIIRHLIGTNNLNFPLKSTSKATTSNLEIIIKNSNLFKVVVSFLPLHYVTLLIKDRILEAILIFTLTDDENKCYNALKQNSQQTFKLFYIIGENVQNNTLVKDLLQKIRLLSIKIKQEEYFTEILKENPEIKKEEFPEYIFEKIRNEDSFLVITDIILNNIQRKFSQITSGYFFKDEHNWPVYWEIWVNKEKKENLIKYIRFFTSNHNNYFGKLLTPLVSGMRISGPFYHNDFFPANKSVIIHDGQGFGHEATLDRALSKTNLDLMDSVDKIILIDNGTQPVIGLTLIALEQIFSRGLSKKLAIVFTHFDLIEGDDLPTNKHKEEHLKDAIKNGLDKIYHTNKSKSVLEFKDNLDLTVFFIGDLNLHTEKIGKYSQEQIKGLSNFLCQSPIQKKNKQLEFEDENDENRESDFFNGLHDLISEPINNKETEIKINLKKNVDITDKIEKIQPILDSYYSSFYSPVQVIEEIHPPSIKINMLANYLVEANSSFRILWDYRLFGQTRISYSGSNRIFGVGKEHWATIKALTRRIAEFNNCEYNHLRPYSEISSNIANSISCFFSEQTILNEHEYSSYEKNMILDKLREYSTREINQYLYQLLITSNFSKWNNAYSVSGSGSASTRAHIIEGILEDSVPCNQSSRRWSGFLQNIESIINRALTNIIAEIKSGKIIIQQKTKIKPRNTDDKISKEIIYYLTIVLLKLEGNVQYNNKIMGFLRDIFKNNHPYELKRLEMAIDEEILSRVAIANNLDSPDILIRQLSQKLNSIGISIELAEDTVRWIIMAVVIYRQI